ncbi:MAG: metallophosphoesterase [Pleurocapsa minor GSE-CHR-MK-17-07R]|nr:metallophosphoesterase [Pleurocapsa minor GSE-CHR-MK 17-07R]
MSQDNLYFIHMTDTHIKAPGQKNLLNLDMTAKLRAVFAQVKTLSVKPAFFVISGDLAHEGDTADYQHLRAVLDEETADFNAPVFVALGNHDHRGPFREGYLGQTPEETAYYFEQTIDGLRLIVLDTEISSEGEKVEGRLDAEQLTWLKSVLATPAERGTILVLHHPALPNALRLLDDHLLTNPDDLAEAIRDTDVIGLLSGHIHFSSVGSFHGVPSAALAGVAFNLDPTTATSMRFMDSSGFNLGMVRDHHMIVQPMMLPGEHREVFRWEVDSALKPVAEQPVAIPDELQA